MKLINLIFLSALILAGCTTSSTEDTFSISYQMSSHTAGQVSYFVNNVYVGDDVEGVKAITKKIAQLPDQSIIELDEDHRILTSLEGGTVLVNTRGTSLSAFDSYAIPTTYPRLREVIDKKQIYVKIKPRK